MSDLPCTRAAAIASPLAEALETMPQPLSLYDTGGDQVLANAAWRALVGVDTQAGNAAVSACVAALARACRAAAAPSHTLLRLGGPEGVARWYKLTLARWPLAGGAQPLIHASLAEVDQEVSQCEGLAHTVATYQRMANASIDCIKVLTPQGVLQHMNSAGCLALNVAEAAAAGQRWLDLLPGAMHPAARRALARAAAGKACRFSSVTQVDGTPRHWDNLLTPVTDDHGKVTSILCVSRDVTALRSVELRLRDACHIDALTGLPNRNSFKTQLQRSLAQHSQGELSIGLLLVDLDHFKHVNDTLGHAAGDHLLRSLARRLRACLPGDSYIARLDGDEFAIILPQLPHMDALLEAAARIQRQAEPPILHHGKPINVGMSIGCTLYPRDARNASGLLRCADAALSDIKTSGRGGVRMYNVHLMHNAARTAAQVIRARAIVREKSIEPFYQAKIRIDDQRIQGFEALLRWRDRRGQARLPRQVAEAFKNYELATRISDGMRERVFSDIAAWRARGLLSVPISLNAAPVEFLRDDYAERLLQQMQSHGIPTELIEIEITEHSLSERSAAFVERALRKLKQAGVRIALDDFGTGHSSFTNLRDYPVDFIKIDRDFIHRMHSDAVIAAIVRALCQLGPALHMTIIAEGVETPAQLDMLRETGCTIAQGFLFHHPQPAAAIARLLLQDAARNVPAPAPAAALRVY